MMRTFCLFVLCLGVVAAKNILRYGLDDADELFEAFLKTYNKIYDAAEKELRREIFLKNLNQINKLNEKSTSTEFGITQFTDLTSEEFLAKYTGYKRGDMTGTCIDSNDLHLKPVHAPDAFDWRDKGVVTKVKAQHNCGSCWAFSITGNVESAYAIKTNKTILLSEQQLIDCDKESMGCSGGIPVTALKYLTKNGAISEDDYPYEAIDDKCRYNSSKVKVHLEGCAAIHGTEDDIKTRLVQMGPLSIAIDAVPIQHHTNGVVKGSHCQGFFLNHAVLLVGYGTDEDGTPYWLIKNSWGPNRNEHGYFRIQRGVNCLLITEEPPLTALIKA